MKNEFVNKINEEVFSDNFKTYHLLYEAENTTKYLNIPLSFGKLSFKGELSQPIWIKPGRISYVGLVDLNKIEERYEKIKQYFKNKMKNIFKDALEEVYIGDEVLKIDKSLDVKNNYYVILILNFNGVKYACSLIFEKHTHTYMYLQFKKITKQKDITCGKKDKIMLDYDSFFDSAFDNLCKELKHPSYDVWEQSVRGNCLRMVSVFGSETVIDFLKVIAAFHSETVNLSYDLSWIYLISNKNRWVKACDRFIKLDIPKILVPFNLSSYFKGNIEDIKKMICFLNYLDVKNIAKFKKLEDVINVISLMSSEVLKVKFMKNLRDYTLFELENGRRDIFTYNSSNPFLSLIFP